MTKPRYQWGHAPSRDSWKVQFPCLTNFQCNISWLVAPFSIFVDAVQHLQISIHFHHHVTFVFCVKCSSPSFLWCLSFYFRLTKINHDNIPSQDTYFNHIQKPHLSYNIPGIRTWIIFKLIINALSCCFCYALYFLNACLKKKDYSEGKDMIQCLWDVWDNGKFFYLKVEYESVFL